MLFASRVFVSVLLATVVNVHAWDQFLDGTALPEAPWIPYQDGPEDERGDTEIVSFVDPATGASNSAIRINSGTGSNEWYVGALGAEVRELAAGARFRVVESSETGKENLLCVQVGGNGKHSPSISITVVDGRFKVWAYTFGTFGDPEGGQEIMDIGPVDKGVFHTVYLYGHEDGMSKLWWDGRLVYDDSPISLGGFAGYVEWGCGSWQFDASTVVEFDWVGYGGPSDLPLYLTATPGHASVFHSAADGLRFDVITNGGPGVPREGIALTLNGTDRTPALAINGTGSNLQATFLDLLPNQAYQARIRITDLSGATSNYSVDFDTFDPLNLTFEAEDFNFDGGKFLDGPVLSSEAGPDNYLHRDGVEDVDHEELSEEPAAGGNVFRETSLVGTERASDTLRPEYLAAQSADPSVVDHNLAGIAEGEWLNYTRTFPAGRFYIYARVASALTDQPVESTLAKVAGATTENQTTALLGSFHAIGHHSQTYSYAPLTDASGARVQVNFAGVETLRLTATTSEFNVNYFILVPVEAPPPPSMVIARTAAGIAISWSGDGFVLQVSERLDATFSAVPNPTNPYIIQPSGAQQLFRLSR